MDLSTPEHSDVQAAAYAVEWDNSDRMMRESAERALAILGLGKDPFHVGNDRKRVDINVFHDRAGHLSKPILRNLLGSKGSLSRDGWNPALRAYR